MSFTDRCGDRTALHNPWIPRGAGDDDVPPLLADEPQGVPRTVAGAIAATGLSVFIGFAPWGVCAAQQTVVVGRGLPEVEVNHDVLDALEGVPSSLGTLIPPGLNVRYGSTIRLVPPNERGRPAPRPPAPKPSVPPSHAAATQMPPAVAAPRPVAPAPPAATPPAAVAVNPVAKAPPPVSRPVDVPKSQSLPDPAPPPPQALAALPPPSRRHDSGTEIPGALSARSQTDCRCRGFAAVVRAGDRRTGARR